MSLNRWVGKEPIIVDTNPGVLNPQERISIADIPDGTGTHLAPAPGERWHIDAMQYDLQTSGVAGLRSVYFYFVDADGDQTRFGILGQDAGQVVTVVLQKGMPYSTVVNTIQGALTVFCTAPLYVDDLQYPCYLNVLPVGGKAADVRNITVIIRRYRQ
jgi:hypothetical protein